MKHSLVENTADGEESSNGDEAGADAVPDRDRRLSVAGENDDPRRAELMDAAFRVIKRRIEQGGTKRAGLLPFRWLTPQEVAEEAGMAPVVFDELWPEGRTSDDHELSAFESFLFYAFGTYRGPIVDDQSLEAIGLHLNDIEELLRVGPSNLQPSERDWLDFRMAMAVSMFSRHERPDYVLFFEEVEPLYQFLLYQIGRQMRDPLTVRDLAISLTNIFESSWIRRIHGVTDPNPTVHFKLTPDSDAKDWTIDAIAAWSILQAMTEPVERPSGRTDGVVG